MFSASVRINLLRNIDDECVSATGNEKTHIQQRLEDKWWSFLCTPINQLEGLRCCDEDKSEMKNTYNDDENERGV